jgi:hypothetical protein
MNDNKPKQHPVGTYMLFGLIGIIWLILATNPKAESSESASTSYAAPPAVSESPPRKISPDENMARATIYNDQCAPLSMNGLDIWYMTRVSLRREFITLEGFNAASAKIRRELAAQLVTRNPSSLDSDTPHPASRWCASNEATVKQFLTSTFRVTDR